MYGISTYIDPININQNPWIGKYSTSLMDGMGFIHLP